MREHHPGEKRSPLLEMQSGDMHNKLACFSIFHGFCFRLRKNEGLETFPLNYTP